MATPTSAEIPRSCKHDSESQLDFSRPREREDNSPSRGRRWRGRSTEGTRGRGLVKGKQREEVSSAALEAGASEAGELTKKIGSNLRDREGVDGDQIQNLSNRRFVVNGDLCILILLVRLVLFGVDEVGSGIQRIESSGRSESFGGSSRIGSSKSLVGKSAALESHLSRRAKEDLPW